MKVDLLPDQVESTMDEILKKSLRELSDEDLFTLLDSASEELKRRNCLLGPSVSNIRDQPIEQTVQTFIEAIGELGIRMKEKT